jgi:hypothetical protein
LSTGVVVYRMTGGVNAIDEYSRNLVDALGAIGVDARYVCDGLSSLHATQPRPVWVLLQYSPFGYGRWGFAPYLVRDAVRLRRRGVSLALMVHEAWMTMTDWRTVAMGLWQRAQLRALLRTVDRVVTSTEALAVELDHGATHLPIASNIRPVDASRAVARGHLGLNGKLAVALFGRGHPTRAIDHAEAAIAALSRALGADEIAILNLGAGAPQLTVPSGVEVLNTGWLAPDELSLRLLASDLALLPFTDGVSTRRTTLMAALAHGLAVVGSRGDSTDAVLAGARDALTLTPAGDTAAFARAAVELAADRARRRAAAEAGRRLYESVFDWPHLAERVAALVRTLT